MTTVQRVLDNTACSISVHAPIIMATGVIKITLSLGFCLYNRDNLGTGLHQFGLGQHTSAVWEVLKSRADQHQVIVVSGATPSLADAATLTAPDGVSLPTTLAIA